MGSDGAWTCHGSADMIPSTTFEMYPVLPGACLHVVLMTTSMRSPFASGSPLVGQECFFEELGISLQWTITTQHTRSSPLHSCVLKVDAQTPEQSAKQPVSNMAMQLSSSYRPLCRSTASDLRDWPESVSLLSKGSLRSKQMSAPTVSESCVRAESSYLLGLFVGQSTVLWHGPDSRSFGL
eukprot:5560080-Amphidinium_carterae.2